MKRNPVKSWRFSSEAGREIAAGNAIDRSAFTLIELLVVMGVIAVLAALLMGVVGKVRMRSFETQGLSNIRQLGIGFLGAAQENNGILPGWVTKKPDGVTPAGAEDRWQRVVNSYMTGVPLSSTVFSPAFKDPAGIARDQISKSAPYHFAPLAGITKDVESQLGVFRRLVKHSYLSRQILLADAGVDQYKYPAADLYAVDGGHQNWDGFRTGMPTGPGNDPINPGNGEIGNIRWYEGSAKFFFLDGHVEKRKQEDVLKLNVNPLYP